MFSCLGPIVENDSREGGLLLVEAKLGGLLNPAVSKRVVAQTKDKVGRAMRGDAERARQPVSELPERADVFAEVSEDARAGRDGDDELSNARLLWQLAQPRGQLPPVIAADGIGHEVCGVFERCGRRLAKVE